MTIYFCAAIVVALILGVTVFVLALKITRLQAQFDDIFEAFLDAIEDRARCTTELADLIVAIEPLLEKTDWMTGRWGGQFNVLVRMEERRNKVIDDIRSMVMSTYPVEQQVAEDPTPLMPKIGAPL